MHDGRDTRGYWEERVRPYLGTDAELVSVTATGLPDCFGRYTDWLERRTLRRAVQYLSRDGPLLEIGCGYGRWFDLWANRGRPFVGVDFTLSLLQQAKAKHPGGLWVAADVRSLPFRTATFESFCSVKVLQCLCPEERPRAVAELFRVLSPSGCGMLLEKIKDEDGSQSAQWIQWGTSIGAALVKWTGNEYAPVDRGVDALRKLLHRWLVGRDGDPGAMTLRGSSGLVRTRWKRLYRGFLAVRRIAVWLSQLLEPVAEKTLPRDWAVHGLFLFRKI